MDAFIQIGAPGEKISLLEAHCSSAMAFVSFEYEAIVQIAESQPLT